MSPRKTAQRVLDNAKAAGAFKDLNAAQTRAAANQLISCLGCRAYICHANFGVRLKAKLLKTDRTLLLAQRHKKRYTLLDPTTRSRS